MLRFRFVRHGAPDRKRVSAEAVPSLDPTIGDDVRRTEAVPLRYQGHRPPLLHQRRGAAGPRSAPARGCPPPACDFLSFAHHLGRVALQQMVGMRDPATGEVVSSLDGAKETIEILRMLKLKTQGNLTPDEAKFLQQVLSELQLEFARRARSAKP